MATETKFPDALVVETGLTGPVTNIDEDPASPDANWLTSASNTNTEARVSFPTPTGSPTVGAGLQTFRVLVRKTNQSTNPTCVVELWESGGAAALATVVASTTVSSTTGTVLSGTWNASLLGTASGANVECRVVGSVGGGSPGNRAAVEVGAIAWDVTYTVVPKTVTVSGAITPAGGLVRRAQKALAGIFGVGFRATMMALAPKSYWRLGESSGTDSIDETGFASGTYGGSPTLGATGLLSDGDSDTAVTFNGTNQSQTFPASGAVAYPSGNSPWTLVAMIKTTDTANAQADILAYGTASTNQDVVLSLNAGGISFNGHANANNFGGSYADGNPHLVALTWDGTTMIAYGDGVQQGSGFAAGARALPTPSGGHIAVWSNFFNGTIDEVAIFDYALSASQMAALYAASTAAPHGFIGAVAAIITGGRNFTVGGVIAPVGALTKQASRSFAGTAASAGGMVRQAQKALAGAAASVGAMVRQPRKALSGAAASAGALVRQPGKALSGAATSAGALVRQTSAIHAGIAASAGALIRKTSRSAAGVAASAGALVPSKVVVKVVGGTVAAAGGLVRQTTHTFAGTAASAGVLARQTGKALSGSAASSGTASLVKAFLRSFSGSIASAGTFQKQVRFTISGTAASAGTLARRTARTVAGAIASVGSAVVIRPGNQFSKSLAGTIASSGALAREVMVVRGGAIAPAGALLRQTRLALAGTVGSSGSLSRMVGLVRSGSIAAVGALSRLTGKRLDGSAAATGDLARTVMVGLSGVISSVGVGFANKAGQFTLTLAGTIAASGSVLPTKLRSLLVTAARGVGSAVARSRGSTGSR